MGNRLFVVRVVVQVSDEDEVVGLIEKSQFEHVAGTSLIGAHEMRAVSKALEDSLLSLNGVLGAGDEGIEKAGRGVEKEGIEGVEGQHA